MRNKEQSVSLHRYSGSAYSVAREVFTAPVCPPKLSVRKIFPKLKLVSKTVT